MVRLVIWEAITPIMTSQQWYQHVFLLIEMKKIDWHVFLIEMKKIDTISTSIYLVLINQVPYIGSRFLDLFILYKINIRNISIYDICDLYLFPQF